MPKQILILDSSQLQQIGECPQMWHLSNIENLTLSNEIRDDFAMGTYGHKLLEIYYSNLRKHTLTKALKEINNYVLPEDYPLSHERRESVFNRVRDYWMKYSTVGDILISVRNEPSIIFDEDGFPAEILQKEPLVEKGFSYPLLSTNEYLFILEGKIDVIGWMSGQELFMDHKFQSRAHKLYSRSIQFRNYALATGFHTGIINYVRLHKEMQKDTLEREIISFSVNQLREWKEELTESYIHIAKMVKGGKPRKERAACNGKYGFPCQYTKICDETELITIQAIKDTLYHQKEHWSPW